MKLRVALLLLVFLISQTLPSVQSWISVSATQHSHSHQKQFDTASSANLHAACMEVALEEEAEDSDRKSGTSIFEWVPTWISFKGHFERAKAPPATKPHALAYGPDYLYRIGVIRI